MMFLLIIFVFYIPLNLCFELKLSFQENIMFFMILEILPGLLFFLDILITLNTSYYFKGTIVESKFKIAKNYFRNNFFLDIISLGLILKFYLIINRNIEIIYIIIILNYYN